MPLDDPLGTMRAIRWGVLTDELHYIEAVINACRQERVAWNDPDRMMLLEVLLSVEAQAYVGKAIAEYGRQSGGGTDDAVSVNEYIQELAPVFVQEFGISWYVASEHPETMHAVWTIDEFVHAFVEAMISY